MPATQSSSPPQPAVASTSPGPIALLVPPSPATSLSAASSSAVVSSSAKPVQLDTSPSPCASSQSQTSPQPSPQQPPSSSPSKPRLRIRRQSSKPTAKASSAFAPSVTPSVFTSGSAVSRTSSPTWHLTPSTCSLLASTSLDAKLSPASSESPPPQGPGSEFDSPVPGAASPAAHSQ